MKTLSRSDAQAQGRRLQASPALAPQSEDGRKEIVDCLLRNCVDVEHARRTMTYLLDNCEDPRNLTAALRSAAESTRNVQQALPDGCDRCRLDPDPQTKAPRWMAHVPEDRGLVSCAVRCDCARGQWLSRRDRERQNDQPEVPKRDMQPADFGHRSAGERDE
jgi:hypothetical protein